MAIVQSKTASGNSGTSASATFSSPTTAGNLLVMTILAAKNPGAVTFTPPANWVQIGATQNDVLFVEVSGAAYYYPNNPGGITSVATTMSSAPSGWDYIIAEISGVATSSPLDAGTMVASTSGSNHPSVSVTTTTDGDILVGFTLQDQTNGAVTITEPAGWTRIAQVSDAGGWATADAAWDTQTTHGTATYNPTLNISDDGVYGIAAFKPASGGTVSGSGSMVGNAVVASDGVNLQAGPDTVVANATLSGPATLLAAAEPLPGNSSLSGVATLMAGPEPLQQNSTLGGSAVLRAGADSLAGNGVLASPGAILFIGPNPLASTGVLLSSGARILTGPDSLIGNSLLVNPGISSGGSLVGNAVLSGVGIIVAGGNLQANSALSGAALLIPGIAVLGGNAVLLGQALLVAGPEDLMGNSRLLNPSISSGGTLVGNSILSGAGILMAGGQLSGNATLSGAAHLLAGLFTASSSGVLSGPGTLVAGPEALVAMSILASVLLKLPDIITLSDLALALAILFDAAPIALLTDNAPLAILGDEYGQ